MPRWSGEVRVRFAPWQHALYRFVRGVVGGVCKVLWRVRVQGLEHIPASGPFILAPVHRSNVDTPLVSLMGRRLLRFMGKDTMWKFRFSDWFFTSMGGFPVHRGTPDRDALRSCERLLADGQALVIFPEGTRRRGPVVDEIFEGPAYLSAKLQVPIVPVGLGGSEGAMPKGSKGIRLVKISIVIGEPITPPAPTESGRVGRKGVRALTDQLQQRLQILFDEAQADVAGRG
ncbi:MAG: 1-acyl-sn-glycerol-3-phosphate acyltransferase [Acidimicrobiia bacterium]|nr:1-acyl-sn-glycerol-3-phosphate acyltransferase [Acidimicrobiia bacterium]